MTNKTKAAIEQAATKAWEDDVKHNPHPNNPHAYRYGFKQGAQHVIEHHERYGLITQDKALQASRPVIERLNERRRQVEAAREEAGELRRILGIIHNITTDDRVHKLAGKAIGWEDKK